MRKQCGGLNTCVNIAIMKVILTDQDVQEIIALLRKVKTDQSKNWIKQLREKNRHNRTIEAYQEAAQGYTRDGEIEVDDNATVSLGDDSGAYVQAWLWVEKEDMLIARRMLKKLCATQPSVPKTSSDLKTQVADSKPLSA